MLRTVLYDILFCLFAVIYFPYVLVRGKWHKGFWQRMGFFSRKFKNGLPGCSCLWFHAVSVGEVQVIKNLILRVRTRFPERPVVLSTVTTTGFALARTILPEVEVIYAPLDLSLIVREFIRVIDPYLYVTAETEVWPNLFDILDRKGVPVLVVNGRISDQAFGRYKIFRKVFLPLFKSVRGFFVQTQEDANRVTALGASPDRVKVCGNMKFDDVSAGGAGSRPTPADKAADRLVWLAGSTHPGEEDVILDIYQEVIKNFSQLRLILVPRHVERSGQVAGLVRARGLTARTYSRLPQGFDQLLPQNGQEVLVVDRIGVLKELYPLADVVFVGKSLTAQGGQNVIEPAACGKPVLVGPHTQNFRAVINQFLQAQAIRQVNDATELKSSLSVLLSNRGERDRLGLAALQVVLRNRGATQRVFAHLESYLSQ